MAIDLARGIGAADRAMRAGRETLRAGLQRRRVPAHGQPGGHRRLRRPRPGAAADARAAPLPRPRVRPVAARARRSAARAPSRRRSTSCSPARASCSCSPRRRATTSGFLGERELRLIRAGGGAAADEPRGRGRLRRAGARRGRGPAARRGRRVPGGAARRRPPAPRARRRCCSRRTARAGCPRRSWRSAGSRSATSSSSCAACRPSLCKPRGAGDGRADALPPGRALLGAHGSPRRRALQARMRLHDYAGSGNCYKVRLLLAPARRSSTSGSQVDIFAGDTLTDAYGALNPVRETPVLELDYGDGRSRSRRRSSGTSRGARRSCPPTGSGRAHVLQWLAFEQERVMGGIGGPRFRRLTGRPAARRAGSRSASRRSRCSTRTCAGARVARRRRAARSPTSPCSATRTSRRDAGLEPGRHVRAWMERLARAARVRRRPRAVRRRTPGRAPAAVDLRLTRRLSRPCPPAGRRSRGAPPRRPRGAARRRRARGRALALPLDRRRPGAARRPDRRHRLDVDGHDAVQLHAARALRRGRRGGRRGRRRRAPVQHDRGLRQPVAGHAGDARVADLARGDRRLDRADVRSRTTSTRCVCIVGCDKTTPAALMALARVDKPAVLLYSGPQRAGRLGDRELTILEVWEAVGAHERGLIDRARARRDRARRVPGRGHVRRAVHGEHDGGGARLPRAGRARRRADPGRGPRGEGRSRGARGRAARGRARRAPDPTARHVPRPARRCATRWRASRRAAARRTACCTCSRSRARRASS